MADIGMDVQCRGICLLPDLTDGGLRVSPAA